MPEKMLQRAGFKRFKIVEGSIKRYSDNRVESFTFIDMSRKHYLSHLARVEHINGDQQRLCVEEFK